MTDVDEREIAALAAEFLEEGAEAIETYGWVRGQIGSTQVGLCSLGGLQYAIHQRVDGLSGYSSDRERWNEAVRRRLIRGFSEAKRFLKAQFAEPQLAISDWNDEHAKDVQEVLDTFHAAAKEAHKVAEGIDG